MMIYTSGTTSRPKGVLLSNGNLVANARAIAAYLQITPNDKVLCGLPFHFSYGSSVLNSNLISGAQLLLEDNFAFPQQTLKRCRMRVSLASLACLRRLRCCSAVVS